MDLPVKRSQRGIFPQEKYEIVSIDRCSFKTYDDCIEGTGSDCGKNPFYHLGIAILRVCNRETAMFRTIREH